MKLTKESLKSLIKEVKEEIAQEATMGSVKDRVHAGSYSDRPERTAKEFVVMSSDRGERSDAENKQKYREFKQKVKSAGFPFTEFVGSWEETDEKTKEKRRVTENSVIIYSDKRPDVPEQTDDLFEFGMAMSKEYAQEAFIYGELVQSKGGQTRVIQAFGADGKVQDWGGPWSSMQAVKDDETFWSKVRGSGAGSAFQFKERAKVTQEVDAPNSVIDAMREARRHGSKKLRFIRRNK